MESYTTDEERVEALKRWWKENGLSLIGGLAIGLSVLAGWNYWTDHKHGVAGQASVIYTGMMAAVNQHRHEDAQSSAGELISNYSDSPYAVNAAMALAKIKVEQGNFPAAESQLRWAMGHASQAAIQHIARLRLARVLTAQKKYDDALAEFSGIDTGRFTAMYEELRGDILFSQGHNKEAYAAFQNALSTMDPASQSKVLLQMKIDSIGDSDVPKEGQTDAQAPGQENAS